MVGLLIQRCSKFRVSSNTLQFTHSSSCSCSSGLDNFSLYRIKVQLLLQPIRLQTHSAALFFENSQSYLPTDTNLDMKFFRYRPFLPLMRHTLQSNQTDGTIIAFVSL